MGRKTKLVPPETRERLPFAGALRALATLSVVVYHVGLLASGYGFHKKVDLPTWIYALGPIGVGCFFALSGFLLSRPYFRSFERKEKLPDWRAYARDRFLRIYPLYAFLVVIFWLAAPWLQVTGSRPADFWDALSHLTFVFPWVPFGSAARMDPPMWTMAIDVQFYLLLPLLFWALSDLFRPALRVKGYIGAVIGLIAVTLIWRTVTAAYAQQTWNHPELRVTVLWELPGMFTAFGGGMIGAMVWERARDQQRRIAGYIGLAVAAVLFFFAARVSPGPTPAFMVWQEVLADGGAAGLLLAGCALLRASWIENVVVRWAERLSYAIYLTHIYIVYAIVKFTGSLPGWSFFYITIAVAVIVAAAIAVPLYLLVERPFLELKARLRSGVTSFSAVRTRG